MSDVAAVILGAVGGAIVSGIISILLWFANGSREDAIRKDERTNARNLLAQEHEYSDRVRVYEREQERLSELRAEARLQARSLLAQCRDLLLAWDTQVDERGTYSYDRAWTREYEHTCRLLPDEEFRNYLLAAIRVINETWVVESVGELTEPGVDVQRQQLNGLLTELTRYAGDGTWDRSRQTEATSAQESINDAWETYHADRL